MIIIDERGRIESLSTTAERLFGYRAEEACGHNVSLLMPSPYREQHDAYIGRYLETGERRIEVAGEAPRRPTREAQHLRLAPRCGERRSAWRRRHRTASARPPPPAAIAAKCVPGRANGNRGAGCGRGWNAGACRGSGPDDVAAGLRCRRSAIKLEPAGADSPAKRCARRRRGTGPAGGAARAHRPHGRAQRGRSHAQLYPERLTPPCRPKPLGLHRKA